jgi:hypothetical protein
MLITDIDIIEKEIISMYLNKIKSIELQANL